MANGLFDMFQPQDPLGQPTSFGNALADRSNSLVGMGMGLLSPYMAYKGESPYTNALRGFSAGAATDTARANQQAQLQMDRAKLALAQQQANREPEQLRILRATGVDPKSPEGRQILFPKQGISPSIHWETSEDPYGAKTTTPWLILPDAGSPNGVKIQKIDPNSAQISGLPTTTGGPVPFTTAQGAPSAGSPADETAIPPTATYAQAGQPERAPIPPDVNPKIYVEKYSKEQADLAAKQKDRERVSSNVLKIIDGLEEKTRDPLFAQATGPNVSWASNQEPNTLWRQMYERGQDPKAQMMLRLVKQDAQAINSELQRAYLSGQGSVTENERAQISQILGDIAGARSPTEAQAMLRNVRTIIATAAQRGYVVPGGPAAAPPTSSVAPSPATSGTGREPVRVRTPAEARQLPSGTRIILPDGSEGRVP